jgi:hypothetical protein
MAFTLVGYTEAQDSAVLVNVAALVDPHVRVVGDDIVVPAVLPYVGGVYAIGSQISRAQLVSPSIRRRYPLEITPIEIAAEPADPVKFNPFFGSPIGLDADEALNAQAAEDGAGAGRSTVLVWLCDGATSPISGEEMFTIRATNSSTLTAFAWTNGALTLSDTLPAGTYAVVGMRVSSAGMLAARLVFSQYPWRPGCIGSDTLGEQGASIFRMGNLGVWGNFEHNTPPTVDFLSVSADTSQTVDLDLVLVSGRLSGPGRS